MLCNAIYSALSVERYVIAVEVGRCIYLARNEKRDFAYYRNRLAKKHPLIYAEVVEGRLSVRAASAKAELIRLPTRLGALKREWRKAKRAEQRQFVVWVMEEAKARGAVLPTIADTEGRLCP